MPPLPVQQLRVLQLVADTDTDPAVDAALELHRGLAEAGLEVRTLALAPGDRPGHEAMLPVIAPSRRSFAARSGVQTERRWADIIVLHGPRTLVAATLPRRSDRVATVYAAPPGSDPADPFGSGRLGARFADRVAAVVGPEIDASGWVEALERLADHEDRGARG